MNRKIDIPYEELESIGEYFEYFQKRLRKATKILYEDRSNIAAKTERVYCNKTINSYFLTGNWPTKPKKPLV